MRDTIKVFIEQGSAANGLDIHFQGGQKWLHCRVTEYDDTTLLVTYREGTFVVSWAAIQYLQPSS